MFVNLRATGNNKYVQNVINYGDLIATIYLSTKWCFLGYSSSSLKWVIWWSGDLAWSKRQDGIWLSCTGRCSKSISNSKILRNKINPRLANPVILI